MKEVPLIPRKLLFGNPDKTMARLSPDGSKLSYLAPVDGVLNVWVGPADDPEAAKPVTKDTNRGIRMYAWAYTNTHVLYIQDKGGDENWRLYGVDLSSGEIKDYTPLEGVRAEIGHISANTPGEILIGLNDRDAQYHDIHRLNLLTGERQLVLENDGFAGFLTDETYQVRFGMRATPDGGMDVLKRTPNGEWGLYFHIGMQDAMTTQPFGFDDSGRYLYLSDSRDRNTSALYQIDTETDARNLLVEDPRADLDSVMMHPAKKTIQAAAFNFERKEWQILDASIQADLDFLRTLADGEVEVVSRTHDDRWWIVAYLVDAGPVRYYRYDRTNRKAYFLFTDRKELDGQPLAKMYPVTIQSRDGMQLVSYYTLPLGSDKDGVPQEPLPMVLLVHGGPWGRDVWGFNRYHQWLANRGYAVLSVNFRASTGLGKDFTNAGNKQWGAKMHDDLIDAVEWAIAKGITRRGQVVIMGGSYGGYATLAGLTFTPDYFAGGVDIVGPSNLITLLETIPPYWAPMLEMLTSRVGDHRTEEGREFLKSCSPLTYADRISRPLLIGQGANDPRVKQAESDQIVQAMQAKNIPVTYVLYPDEGHGFARPENNLSFNAITEAFLAQVLEGRYEPVGDDFANSSLQVPEGASLVPGLTQALE
jgi:dipeptidyl aminopeptidase/acylaminoacyl peptidase